MLSTEIPHPQKVEEAFTIIMNTTDQQIRKEADTYLRNLEQNYPYILVSLFQIFENSQVFVNRLQSLLLIKNVIVRNWTKSQIIEGKKIQNLSDELKNHVKEKIITYLGVIQDDKLKEEINLIISTIAKHDFPIKFPSLENYFVQGLQTIIQSGTIIGSLSYDLIVTLKGVLKNVTKSRLCPFKVQQLQFLLKVWNNLMTFWKSVSQLHQQEIQSNTNTNPLINHLSKKLDRILSLLTFSLHSEQDMEKISYVFMGLLEKSAFLLKFVSQQKLLQPNIKTLVSSLGQIQCLFQLSIIQGLQDYLILLKFIISQDWEDKRIIKSGLVGIYRILKSFFYYCTDKQFYDQFTQPRTEVQLKVRQQANNLFITFFKENLAFLVELFIKIASVPQGLSDEELIEQEEDASIDDSRNEMDYPIYTLCLICEEQLMQRFPDLYIQQVQNIMQQLLVNNFNVNPQILESFFALLGQAPRVTNRLKIQPIQIQPVLQYLINANTIQSQRRFAFLCKNYYSCFSETELPQILEFQLALLNNTQDQIVQYQSLMCIKNIINMQGLNFDFTNIKFFEQITPIIVKLLCNLQKSTILWPLLSLLEKLIFKYSENQKSLQSLIIIIEKADLSKLMTTKSELLLGALCEMFQALFLSFPIGTNLHHLYKLALILIHQNLESKENHIINLLLFLIQEYDPNADNNQTGILFMDLFTQNQKILIEDTDIYHMQVILKIYEELIILNLIPINQSIYDFLIDRIQIASQFDHYDSSQSIKRNCCSLLEAIIIKTFDTLDIKQYQQLICLLIQDLIKMNTNDKLDKVFLNIYCLNHIIENLNRFILKDINFVIQILNSLQISIDQFFILWQDSAQHILNKGNRKINIITTLLYLKYVQKNTFLQSFQLFLQDAFPELNYYQELKNNDFKQKQKDNKLKQANNRISRLPNEHKNSYKKELLQDQFLYDDNFNFIQFFFQQIQESMKIHGITDLQQIINEKDIIEKLNQLFNEQQQQQ